MLTTTGENLYILIKSEIDQDWQAFATWYSIYKNIPNAIVVIACIRNETTPFHCFQWCKRLNIPIFYKNVNTAKWDLIPPCMLNKTVLLIPPLTMAIDVLDEKIIEDANSKEVFFWHDQDVWFFKGATKENIDCNSTPKELVKEAKDTDNICSLVSYKKGCGKWIPSLRGCPLSNASGLISEEMTVNENRIIELWKQMVALYSAVAH